MVRFVGYTEKGIVREKDSSIEEKRGLKSIYRSTDTRYFSSCFSHPLLPPMRIARRTFHSSILARTAYRNCWAKEVEREEGWERVERGMREGWERDGRGMREG